MTPTHHPEPDMLMSYASGSLAEPMALLVATHLALCPRCRRQVMQYEVIGGALLEELPKEPVSTTALQQVLQRIQQPSRTPEEAGSAVPPPREERLLPQPLRDYLGTDLDRLVWRGRGKLREYRLLPQHDGFRTRLLKIRGGAAMPWHTHVGSELTMVFAGGFTDAHGHYRRGDVAVADATVDHRPVADMGEDCICLAVTDAPLRLTGFGAGLLNIFIKQ